MDDQSYPKIASFVVRFVQEQPVSGDQVFFRGLIRHVETDQELTFTNWEAAQAFMEQFVRIKNPNTKE